MGKLNIMEKCKLAIIILNYNSWKLTLKFINEQLSKVNLPKHTKIVVVDNNSSNDSLKHLEKMQKKYNYILLRSKGNNGYAAGNNIGLKWAFDNGFEYGLVANTDIIFENSEDINKMLSIFKMDSRVGVVSPRVFTSLGVEMNRNLFRPSVYDLTFGKIRYRKKGRTLPSELRGKNNDYCYNYRPQGCCMIVDLKKMNSINYMDEHTFLYMEEPILAEKLLRKRIKGACCLNVKIIHNHSTTVQSIAKQRQIYKWQNASEIYYYKKYRHFNYLEIKLCTAFTALYFYTFRKLKKFN